MIEWLFATLLAAWLGVAAPAAGPALTTAARPGGGALDRIAAAVEGAESSHGRDRSMWRPDWRGPQGPMQVSHAASVDVGGGDRFDLEQNRQIGRAYLAGLFRRYGSWVDAVAAYNWGPGNLDRWIAAGRPVAGVAAPIRAYIDRVMREVLDDKANGAASSAAPAAVRPIAARSIFPPVPPAAEPPTPRDPALRKKFERNAAAIQELRDFAAGDADGEGAVRALMRSISKRPGYEEFGGAANPRAAPIAAMREIARVLLGKLQSENAALALVDERRRHTLH